MSSEPNLGGTIQVDREENAFFVTIFYARRCCDEVYVYWGQYGSCGKCLWRWAWPEVDLLEAWVVVKVWNDDNEGKMEVMEQKSPGKVEVEGGKAF